TPAKGTARPSSCAARRSAATSASSGLPSGRRGDRDAAPAQPTAALPPHGGGAVDDRFADDLARAAVVRPDHDRLGEADGARRRGGGGGLRPVRPASRLTAH